MKLKFAIITVGTRGDVQPLVTQSKELLRRGHEVVLFTNETFQSFVSDELNAFAAGWTFVGLHGNITALMRDPRFIDLLQKQDFLSLQKAFAELMDKVYIANANIILETFLSASSTLPDVVIGTLQTWPLSCVLAEGWNRPMAFFSVIPPAFPADDMAPCLLSPCPLPFAWMNVTAATLLMMVVALTFSNPQDVHALQARLRLPPKPIVDIVKSMLHTPFLLAYSPTLRPMPARWVRDGHWVYEGGAVTPIPADPDAPLPTTLEAFLSRGTGDVVFFGWGSMVYGDAVAVTRMVLQCVDLLVQQGGGGRGRARRAIVQSGWAGLALVDLQNRCVRMTTISWASAIASTLHACPSSNPCVSAASRATGSWLIAWPPWSSSCPSPSTTRCCSPASPLLSTTGGAAPPTRHSRRACRR